MGAMSKIAITGAAGFLGRACVAEARRRGHAVVAIVRGAHPAAWAADPGIQPVIADLADPASLPDLSDAVQDVDALIHAAAHMGGDPQTHKRDTFGATQLVLQAMRSSKAHIVLVSSIGVYDTDKIVAHSDVTEASPLIDLAAPRDAYSSAKLHQEHLIRASARPYWILRPGVIWGAGQTWHALTGFWAGPVMIACQSRGELPLVHVSHAARSLIDAAVTTPGLENTLNVIDDDLPTRFQFCVAHKRLAGWPRVAFYVPWPFWLGAARVLRPIARRLPGLLREPIARARLMPVFWPNTRLRDALGGEDKAAFSTLLAQSLETHP